MGLFNWKKNKETIEPTPAGLTLTLEAGQVETLNAFKEKHKQTCSASAFDIIARVNDDKGIVRFFVTCSKCGSGRELEGPQTPSTIL